MTVQQPDFVPRPSFVPRMEGLDALRGFALMGLFLVHIQESFELYWSKPVPHPVTDAVWGLFMGKSFSLLALCFGVSFFIIMDRQAAKGVDFTARFLWRLCILVLIGLAHNLVYRGDVLQVLAVSGVVLVLLYRVRSNAVLVTLAALCLLQPQLLWQIAEASRGAQWANRAPLSWGDTSLIGILKGDMWDVIRINITDGWKTKWLFFLESGRLVQMIGLYIIGLWLGRIGFFSTPEAFAVPRRIALAALAALWLALPEIGKLAAHIPQTEGQFMARATFGGVISGWRDVTQMGVMMLVFVELYQSFARKLLHTLAPVGRMTLTLYVAQAIVFVPLFYPFGLDLYHRITPWQALYIGLTGFAVQLVFAHLWFKGFYYGPLEWIWRAATYLTVKVPFRRRTSA